MRWLYLLLLVCLMTAAYCEEEESEEKASELERLNDLAFKNDDGGDDGETGGDEEEEELEEPEETEKEFKEEDEEASHVAAAEPEQEILLARSSWFPKNKKNWYGYYNSFYQKSKKCKCWIGVIYGQVIFSFKPFSLPGYSHYPHKPFFKYWPPKPDYQSWCSRRCSKKCTVQWGDKLHDYKTICKKLAKLTTGNGVMLVALVVSSPNDRPNHIWDMDAHPGKFCCKPKITCKKAYHILDNENKRCLKPVCKAPCLNKIGNGILNGYILLNGTFYKPYPWITGAEEVDCANWKKSWDRKHVY